MPATDDRLAELLHAVTPDPPDELLDLTRMHARARRRRRTRAVTFGTSLTAIAAVTTAVVLHLTGSRTTAPPQIVATPPPSPTPTSPPVNDVIVTTDCRARVVDGRLAATFALDSTDRFEPPGPAVRPAHTAAQALAAYKPYFYGGHRGSKPQAFFATHSMHGEGHQLVWAVVTYHVTGPPPMGPSGGQSTLTDEIQVFDAATLHPLWNLYAMPITC